MTVGEDGTLSPGQTALEEIGAARNSPGETPRAGSFLWNVVGGQIWLQLQSASQCSVYRLLRLIEADV